MHPDTSPARILLAAARQAGPAAELRCRALLERSACSDALRAALQHELARGGLTESGFRVLAVLQARAPAAVCRSEVAAAAGLSSPHAAAALTRLEMSHFVRRHQDGRNRRLVWLRLTPAGEAQIDAAIRGYVAGVMAVTEPLAEPDLAACLALSAKLRTGLDRRVTELPLRRAASPS